MEPIRANVLQLPQIVKEVSSLEASISSIQASLKRSEQFIQASYSEKESKEAQLIQENVDQKSKESITSQVYRTQGPLPKRFEEPCNFIYTIDINSFMELCC